MRVGFIGLGEAGAIYAAAVVAAGHEVTGFDPAPTDGPAGVTRLGSVAEVAASTDLLVVLTSAALSRTIAGTAAGAIAPGTVYADFTTASPEDMVAAGDLVTAAGGRFADVAILGPVPLKGAATETIVSGDAADAVGDLLVSLGSDVERVDGPPGTATSRKLLRSVLMKSLATVVVEALEAGRAAGCEEWVRAQIAAQLSGDADAKIERYESGSRKHAVRRAHEMQSVAEYLGRLGVEPEMSAASRRVLERLAGSTPER
jgi:3-hydroxyisobutyrate dehydrogenase-like beta-hydroxyacid dehydrogenase